jgi:3',5'-cyclic AMP phosphodiesterase CpdA
LVLVQLSDAHIGGDWAPTDPVAGLEAAVRAVLALDLRPAAVLVSGDIADNAEDGEYELARELLERLGAPLCVLPGNHDARGALRRHFELPGADDEPVQYVRELDGLRLVVLDTTRPGSDAGELDAARLAWLDAELAAAPDAPTLVAMHHPPVVTGVPVWDEIGLAAADQHALGEVVARHRQVQRLTGGHVHRAIASDLVGRAVLVVPSTYVQLRLDFDARELEVVPEPAMFAVHTLRDGRLVSHLAPVS